MTPSLQTSLCGIPLNNPILAASGTAAFGMELHRLFGLNQIGGVVLKAVTLHPREGNAVPRVAETPSGMHNAVGLQNPGVESFVRDVLPAMAKLVEAASQNSQAAPYPCALIANIAGAKQEEYVAVAEALAGQDALSILELNISCPNVHAGGAAFGQTPEAVAAITRAVRAALPQKRLMVKLTPNAGEIVGCALAAQEAGADCLSLINTLTGMAVDVRTRRPILGNLTGGLSGPAVKPIALRMVYQVSQAVSIPVVGLGGIMTGEDAAAFLLCGAAAVQVGTAQLCDPRALPRIVSELKAYCDHQGVSDVRELTGGLVVPKPA